MWKYVLPVFLSLHATAGTVLYIGDSHSVGPFGWYLDEHLRMAGHTVSTFASCGSVPGWWFIGKKTTCGYFSKDQDGHEIKANSHATPLIKELLHDLRPDTVILQFGANYLRQPNNEAIKKDIRKIVSLVKENKAECFWITHPDSRTARSEIPRVLDVIKKTISDECRVFESQSVTEYPSRGGDGIHYWFPAGLPMARKWADEAFKAFNQPEQLP